MNTDYQADKAWLLDIQRKLYTWSRAHPDEALLPGNMALAAGRARPSEWA